MKRQKGLSGVVIVSTFIIFTIAMVFVTYYVTNYQSNSHKYFKEYNKKIPNELSDIISAQEKMDQKINDISLNGGYTFENPCVINNPYEISPLSSIIIFDTDKEVEVEVWINDKHVTTTYKTKKHIIPIYGLYSHSNNIVELRTSDNEMYQTTIKTDSYNYDVSDIDIKKLINNKNQYFLLGNTKDGLSNLRGFDYNANLMFYLDLDYLNSIKIQNDHFYVGYNSKMSSSNLQNLKLELDYLGKIYSISTDVSDLNSATNISINDESYIGYEVNMYKEKINTFNPLELVDTNISADKIRVMTNDIESLLDEAKVYPYNYEIATNGDYLTYDFKEQKNVTLAIVGRNAKYTNLYNLDGKNILKLDLEGEYSLYVRINNEYYSLLTIINN